MKITTEKITHSFDLEVVKPGRPVLVVGQSAGAEFDGFYLIHEATDKAVTLVNYKMVTYRIEVADVVDGDITIEFLDTTNAEVGA